MLVVFVPIFGVGVPHAKPGDYADASVWPAVLLFVVIPLLALCGFLILRSRSRRTKPELHSLESEATTKPCGYCGRENDLEAANCKECGTPFLTPESDQNACKHEADDT